MRTRACYEQRTVFGAQLLAVVVVWAGTIGVLVPISHGEGHCDSWESPAIANVPGRSQIRFLLREAVGLNSPEVLDNCSTRVPVVDLIPNTGDIYLLTKRSSSVCTKLNLTISFTNIARLQKKLIHANCNNYTEQDGINCSFAFQAATHGEILTCINETTDYINASRLPCGQGYYQNTAGHCTACNVANCEECENGTASAKCKTCFTTSVTSGRRVYASPNGTCVTHDKCGNRMFGNSSSRTCSVCKPSSCTKCSEGDGQFCFSCDKSSVSNYTCSQSCSDGLVKSAANSVTGQLCILPTLCPLGYHNQTGMCARCSEPNCLACPQDVCESCAQPFYLLREGSGRCVARCDGDEIWRSPPADLLLSNATSGFVLSYSKNEWSPTCMPRFNNTMANTLCDRMQLGTLVNWRQEHADRCVSSISPILCSTTGACAADGIGGSSSRLWLHCSGPPRSWECANLTLYANRAGIYSEELLNEIVSVRFVAMEHKNVWVTSAPYTTVCQALGNETLLEIELVGGDWRPSRLVSQQLSLKERRIEMAADNGFDDIPDEMTLGCSSAVESTDGDNLTVSLISYPRPNLELDDRNPNAPVEHFVTNYPLLFNIPCSKGGGNGTSSTWYDGTGAEVNKATLEVTAKSTARTFYCQASNSFGHAESRLLTISRIGQDVGDEVFDVDYGYVFDKESCNMTVNWVNLPSTFRCRTGTNESEEIYTKGSKRLFYGTNCSCTGSNAFVSGTRNVKFTVPQLVEPNVTATSNSTLTVIEDDDVTLQLTARGQPEPSVTWWFYRSYVDFDCKQENSTNFTNVLDDDQFAFNQTFRARDSGRTKVYTVEMEARATATSKVSGFYVPVAKNDLGNCTAGNTTAVYVKYRPDVDITNPGGFSQGLAAMFECTATSYPAVTYFSWSVNGEEVNMTNPDNDESANCSAQQDLTQNTTAAQFCFYNVTDPSEYDNADDVEFHKTSKSRLVMRWVSANEVGSVECYASNEVGNNSNNYLTSLPRKKTDNSLIIGLSVSMTIVFILLVVGAVLVLRKRDQICEDSEILANIGDWKKRSGRALTSIVNSIQKPNTKGDKRQRKSDAKEEPAAVANEQAIAADTNNEDYECPDAMGIQNTPADQSLVLKHAGAEERNTIDRYSKDPGRKAADTDRKPEAHAQPPQVPVVDDYLPPTDDELKLMSAPPNGTQPLSEPSVKIPPPPPEFPPTDDELYEEAPTLEADPPETADNQDVESVEEEGDDIYEDLPGQDDSTPLDAHSNHSDPSRASKDAAAAKRPGFLKNLWQKKTKKQQQKKDPGPPSVPPLAGVQHTEPEAEDEETGEGLYDDIETIKQQMTSSSPAPEEDAEEGGDLLYECLPEDQQPAAGGAEEIAEEDEDENMYEDPGLMATAVTVTSQPGSSSGAAERRSLPVPPPAAGPGQRSPSPGPQQVQLPPPPLGNPGPQLPPPNNSPSMPPRNTGSPLAGQEKAAPRQSYTHTEIRIQPGKKTEKAATQTPIAAKSYEFTGIRKPPPKGSAADTLATASSKERPGKAATLDRPPALTTPIAKNKSGSLPPGTKATGKATVLQPPPPPPAIAPEEDEEIDDIYEGGEDYIDMALETCGASAGYPPAAAATMGQDGDDASAEDYQLMDAGAAVPEEEAGEELYTAMDADEQEMYLEMDTQGQNAPSPASDELYLDMETNQPPGADDASEELYLDMEANKEEDGAGSGELYMAMEADEAPPPQAVTAATLAPKPSVPVQRSPSAAKPSAIVQRNPSAPKPSAVVQRNPSAAKYGGARAPLQPPQAANQPPVTPMSAATKSSRPPPLSQQALPVGPARLNKKSQPSAAAGQKPLPAVGAKPEPAAPTPVPSRDGKKAVDNARWQGKRKDNEAAVARAPSPGGVGHSPSMQRGSVAAQPSPPPPGRAARPEKSADAAPKRAKKWPPN
ncbi:uncharacterized protein LOC135823410 [Sycon ciliatum]|uniref:uncharacterized protein LOC135823410 n=1 Tax=Sycon ciliatum TaxID=27933 RepID=UPI0031F68191